MGYWTGPTEYTYIPPTYVADPTLTTTLTPYTLWRKKKQAEDAARMAAIVDAWKLDHAQAEKGRERVWSLSTTASDHAPAIGANGGDWYA
jgi:hypothetical protein